MKHLLNSQYQECSICSNIAASDSQAVCTLHHMLSKIESACMGLVAIIIGGNPLGAAAGIVATTTCTVWQLAN